MIDVKVLKKYNLNVLSFATSTFNEKIGTYWCLTAYRQIITFDSFMRNENEYIKLNFIICLLPGRIDVRGGHITYASLLQNTISSIGTY